MWFISANLQSTHPDCSFIFFTVLMYWCTVAELYSSCSGYWSADVVMDIHLFIVVYTDTVSPVGEQFFRLAQKSFGILQYLLWNTSLTICLFFEHLMKSLYMHFFFFVHCFWDSIKSLQTFAGIIDHDAPSPNGNRDTWDLCIVKVSHKSLQCRDIVWGVMRSKVSNSPSNLEML